MNSPAARLQQLRPDPDFLRLLIAERAEELAAKASDEPSGCLRYWARARREVLWSLRTSARSERRNPVARRGSVAA